MEKQILFLGLVVCACTVQASTTLPGTTLASVISTGTHHGHNHHTTKESAEHQTLTFKYYPQTHHLVLHIGRKCYVDTLTMEEQTAVHSNSGLRQLETNMMTNLATATEVNKDQLTDQESKMCGNRVIHVYTMAL